MSPRRANHAEPNRIVFDCSMTTATAVICEPFATVGSIPLRWFSPDEPAGWILPAIDHSVDGGPDPVADASEQPVNPILEMRSTRRSLRDKAREVISDFERDYPW